MPSDRAAAIMRVPLSIPNISGHEWDYVKSCLDAGMVSSVGEFVSRFEREFAAAVGAQYAVAVATGTAALHVALLLAGVEAGDEVIMPSLTFIAPANAVRYLQAFPVFVDVDPVYRQLSADAITDFLEQDCDIDANGVTNRRTGRRVKAVMPVDILGHPADLDAIAAIASSFGLAFVEDGTESLGARYRGRQVGTISPLTAFSFNGNKLLTTGGGGMITTNDEALAARARYLTTTAKNDAIEFVHNEVGFNYRLTNVQAAIGVAQLEQLPEFLATKQRVRARYETLFNGIADTAPMAEAPWASSAFWLYTADLGGGTSPRSRAVMRALNERGIETRPLWQPLHQSPAHSTSYSRPCPVAERLNATCLSLPCSTNITADQLDYVCGHLKELLS